MSVSFASYTSPPHSKKSQADTNCVTVSGWATRKANVTVLSQPNADTYVNVSVSAFSKKWPRHVTGRSPVQTTVSKAMNGGCMTVTCAITILSQPKAFGNVFMNAPLWV